MPSRHRLPARLHTHIRIVCDMMLKTHHLDEAHWLWMAAASARECGSAPAQAALRRAADVALQCGFPDVARWIEMEPLHGES